MRSIGIGISIIITIIIIIVLDHFTRNDVKSGGMTD